MQTNMKRGPQPSYYDFSAVPRVTGPKQKYRQEVEEPLNIMSDPRIVRGNTYAPVPTKSKAEFKPPQQTQKRPQVKNIKTTNRYGFDMGFEVSTPRAVDGRQHFSVQTEAFVETLRDKPIQYEYQCQTDFFLDRPTERLFKFVQNGIDAWTQIEEGDPQLFDFNFQVEPILEALLSKIIDTSRMELFEQEDIQERIDRKRNYELKRNATLAQVQKLQNNQRRAEEEKQRRELQYERYLQQNGFVQKKIIGRILSKQLLKHIKKNSYSILNQQGFFRQPLEADLHDNYLPWLYEQIAQQLNNQLVIQNSTAQILTNYAQSSRHTNQTAIERQHERRANILIARQRQKEEKQRKIREKAEKKARELEEQQAKLASQRLESQPKQEEKPQA